MRKEEYINDLLTRMDENGRTGDQNIFVRDAKVIYDRIKDLPPLEREGVHTKEQQLQRAGYFLKAIVPEAIKANVRLALILASVALVLGLGFVAKIVLLGR